MIYVDRYKLEDAKNMHDFVSKVNVVMKRDIRNALQCKDANRERYLIGDWEYVVSRNQRFRGFVENYDDMSITELERELIDMGEFFIKSHSEEDKVELRKYLLELKEKLIETRKKKLNAYKG